MSRVQSPAPFGIILPRSRRSKVSTLKPAASHLFWLHCFASGPFSSTSLTLDFS